MMAKKKTLSGGIQEALEVINFKGQGIVIFDSSGDLMGANGAAYDFFPALETLLSGDNALSGFFNFLFDNAIEKDTHLINVAAKTTVVPDGGFREVLFSERGLCLVEIYRQESGDRTVVLFRDLDVVRNLEEGYSEATNINRTLVSAIGQTSNGIVVFEKGKKQTFPIVFANEAFLRFFHYENYNPADFQDVLEQCSQGVKAEHIVQKIEKKSSYALDFSLRREGADSKSFYYNLRVTSIQTGDEQDDKYVGVVTDLTELRAREEALSTSKKMDALGQMAAGIAHDFNNILSIANGYLHLCHKALDQGSDFDTALLKEYISKSMKSCDRGAALVGKVLAFSKKKPSTDDVTEVAEAVKEQDLLLQRIVQSPQTLTVSYPNKPLYINLSDDHLYQILMNLLVNARDAIAFDGCINVVIQKKSKSQIQKQLGFVLSDAAHKDFCVIEVTDNGGGMSEEVQEKIFDPFYSTKEQGKGTGLGLSIVYGLVKNAGGHIQLKSKHDEGTSFFVMFPVSMASKAIASRNGRSSGLKDFCGKTVLLVEDEDDLRFLYRSMLENMGFKILEALNGNHGLLVQDEYDQKIDLVLTDVVMPELNGVHFAEIFETMRPGVPVIFMTGYPMAKRSDGLSIPKGAAFLQKPFKEKDLLLLVNKKLEQKKQHYTQP